jgi:hypothetical protein
MRHSTLEMVAASTCFQKADYALARDNEHNRWDEFLSIRGD